MFGAVLILTLIDVSSLNIDCIATPPATTTPPRFTSSHPPHFPASGSFVFWPDDRKKTIAEGNRENIDPPAPK